MKTRIVKVLGFFVLNIIFFTILIGFASLAEKPLLRRGGSQTNHSTQQLPKAPENTAERTYKTTTHNLIISTAVAELAIN